MKIRTPHYYKDFKCIAGACTDTCCAGWDVDVDPESYKYYKSVKGDFGKRLKSVMVPSEDGGCTFTLNNGRCPFLNDENLCDLYTALGEDKLCETCDEFPRFINEYGNVREIGIAPSCITAGELIFNYKEKLTFDMEDDGKPVTNYNDIDGFLYMQLLRAREVAYQIVQNDDFTVDECCLLLLEFAVRIQRHMDKERDDLIENVVYAFLEEDYLKDVLAKLKGKYDKKDGGYSVISKFFEAFEGMEVINPDWFKCLEVQKDFMERCAGRTKGQALVTGDVDGDVVGDATGESEDTGIGPQTMMERYIEFDKYYADRQFEYRQLMMYYVFRYFLDSVYDYNLVLKVKNGIIGYIILKHLDVAKWELNGGALSKDEQIDMAHLYSRQFEHSYTNFEKYSEMFMSRRCYSVCSLRRFLL